MRYDAFISYSHSADDRFAPALQNGLQRLARPWYRRRALRVFRDETGLSVNPHLWASIEGALDDSRYFVLLASPAAAASPWVNREVAHWLATKSSDTLLPVLTDGTLVWDEAAGGFDAAASSALPAALIGAYAAEPKHLDVRWAHEETQLDLRHSQFRSEVATLAAPIHGMPKEDLEDEDVRLHRRAMRLAWGAAAALLLLTVAAVVAAVFAISFANTARDQRHAAQVQAKLARDAAALAVKNEHRANTLAANLASTNSQLDAANTDLAQQNDELNHKTNELNSANSQLNDANSQLSQTNTELSDKNAALARAQAETLQALAATQAAEVATRHALVQTEEAQQATAIALANETAARKAKERERLAGVARALVNGSRQALQAGDIDRGVLLAAEATRFAEESGWLIPQSDVQQPLVDALQHVPSLITYLRGIDGAIVDVAVSPDGTRIAATSEHDEVAVWNLSNFQELGVFRGPPHMMFVAFSDSQTLIASGQHDVRAFVAGSDGSWNVKWTVPMTRFGPLASVSALAVAPGGPIAVLSPHTGDALTRLFVFDRAGNLTGHVALEAANTSTADPSQLAISDNGTRIAVADEIQGADIRLRAFGPDGSLHSTVHALGQTQKEVAALRISADGTRLAVATEDLHLKTFDLNFDTLLSDVVVPTPANATDDFPIGIAPGLDRVLQRYSTDTEANAATDHLGMGFVGRGFAGDLAAPTILPLYGDYTAPRNQGGRTAAFDTRTGVVVTAGGDGAIPVFLSPDRFRSRLSATGTANETTPDTKAALSHDGSTLVTVDTPQSGPSKLHMVDTTTGHSTTTLLPGLADGALPLGIPFDPTLSHGVAFGDAPDVVAVAMLDGSIDLHDTHSGATVLHIPAATPCSIDLASPDICVYEHPDVSFSGTLAHGVVAQAFQQSVHVWTLLNGSVTSSRRVDVEGLTAQLADNGNRIVVLASSSSAPSGVAAIAFEVRAGSWQRVATVPLTSLPVGAAVTRDGRELAVADQHNVSLYALDHTAPIWSQPSADTNVWFDSAGDAVYTAGGAVLTVRTADNGLQQFSLSLPNSSKPSSEPLALAADADRVTFTAGLFLHGGLAVDATMTVESTRWTLSIPSLVGAACSDAARNLTPDEWRLFVGGDPYERTCPGIREY